MPVEVAKAAAIAVFIAGILQALALYWGIRRQKLHLSLIGWPRLTPRVKHILLLAIPGTIAASGTQINILVSQFLASYEVGAKTWLYYADRLYQLPLGLVGVAVGVAILPRLSMAARREDGADSQRMMDEGVGLAMALTLPAAAALFLAPAFLIEGIFTRGAFLSADAAQAGLALVHYAWGVPAFVLIKVLAPGFFAREDTKTPMQFALVSVVINTVLGASLFLWLRSQGQPGFPGLAIATSVAAWANALLLGFGLAQRGWYRPGPVLISRLIRAGLASAAMCGVLWMALQHQSLIRAHIYDSKLVVALIVIFTSMIAYALAALIFGAVRPRELITALKRD
jgi:putative peptidoglycan lipid II flippase